MNNILDTQMINMAIFIIIFIAVLYMWANILEIKEKMKTIYRTGGLKERPKDDCIKSDSAYEKRLMKSYRRNRVDEVEGYVLKIRDRAGETVWGGTKESMLEILKFNKIRYKECDMDFDFEIYPMQSKRCNK